MALMRDFRQTITARVQSEPAYARALLQQATSLLLQGEPHTAKLLLRDLVNASLANLGSRAYGRSRVLYARFARPIHAMDRRVDHLGGVVVAGSGSSGSSGGRHRTVEVGR